MRVHYQLFVNSMFYCFINNIHAANILFITLLGAPSHHVWNEALIGGLLKNGHDITMISHDKPKIQSSNYTGLFIDDPFRSETLNPLEFAVLSPFRQIMLNWDYLMYTCELDLKSKALRDLLAYPRNHFDLIVIDVSAGPCTFPIIDSFDNAIVMGVSPFATPPYVADIMGYDVPSYIPVYSCQYGTDMSLFQKAHNFFLQGADLSLKYYYSKKMFKKSQEVFGNEIRDYHDVMQKITLLLTNNDPILDYPQPFPPNIIPVGGLHIKASKKLPGDLQVILDNSKHGVIYFSMGSILKSNGMSEEYKKIFLKVFGELKQTVLWKFESDGLIVPKNVIIRKWFPQNDILAHKNVVLFISHCGGLSTQEAIFNGIPVLGIPIFVDQHNNAAKMVFKKGGIIVNYFDVAYDKLSKAIKELVSNAIYKKEMERLSTLFRDQQTSPLDKAVFWVEYILRNKETYSTDRSPYSRSMKWYQMYASRLLIIFVLCFLVIILLKSVMVGIYKLAISKRNKKLKTH